MFTFTGFSHVCSSRTLWPRPAVFAKSWRFCPEPCRCVTTEFLLLLLDCSSGGSHKNDIYLMSWFTGPVWIKGSLLTEGAVDVVSVAPSSLKDLFSNTGGFCQFSLTMWFGYKVVLKKTQKNGFDLFFCKASVCRSSLLCWAVQTFPVYEWLVVENFNNIIKG